MGAFERPQCGAERQPARQKQHDGDDQDPSSTLPRSSLTASR
jgi:hypothetical protein